MNEIEELQEDWYKPGESLAEFHESTTDVRFLIGARGVGKTTSCALEAIRHIWHNAGGKAIFIRKTEVSSSDTTNETLNTVFANLGELYQETTTSLFKSWNNGRTIRVPSLLAVDEFNRVLPNLKTKGEIQAWLDSTGDAMCGYIEQRGLPSAKISEGKLRGLECSMLLLVEADLLTETDFAMSSACLRWKGYGGKFIEDLSLIVDTNPPGPRHWIAVKEEETKRGEHPGYQFWHIATSENSHNLPKGYVDGLIEVYKRNPAMLERMVYGRYADAFLGSPVYYNFDQTIHVGEDLAWPEGAYLIRGWDFGTVNSVVYSAYWIENGTEYWHTLAESVLEGSDTERQAKTAKEVTEREFPFWNNRMICAGVIDQVDPSGNNRNFTTDATASAVKILATYGIHPGTNMWSRSISVTNSVVNRLMGKRDAKGKPVFMLDKKNCPRLYEACMGGLRYPEVGEPGYGSGEPLKGRNCQEHDYTHVTDGFRYGVIGCMKLLRIEHEEATKPSNRSKNQKSVNPSSSF